MFQVWAGTERTPPAAARGKGRRNRRHRRLHRHHRRPQGQAGRTQVRRKVC